jgi:hypothetical protein
MRSLAAEYAGLASGELDDAETEPPGAVTVDKGAVGSIRAGTGGGGSAGAGIVDTPDM